MTVKMAPQAGFEPATRLTAGFRSSCPVWPGLKFYDRDAAVASMGRVFAHDAVLSEKSIEPSRDSMIMAESGGSFREVVSRHRETRELG
jgi:hypothetical protein